MADATAHNIQTVQAIVIPILGRVAVKGGQLDADAKPFANNTRWIIDITRFSGEDLEIQLLEPRSGLAPVHPDVLAAGFLPRSESFFRLKPYIHTVSGGTLLVRGAPAPDLFCAFRLCIDAMHTATR